MRSAPLTHRLRSGSAIAALVVAGSAVAACSSRSAPEVSERRSLGVVDRDGVRAELEVQRVVVTHSPGIRPAGRWITWEHGSRECTVQATLRATIDGAPFERLYPLDTEPPRRLFMDDAACGARLRSVSGSVCAARGVLGVEVERDRFLVVAYRGEAFETRADPPATSCADELAAAPSGERLVARRHDSQSCGALLDAGRGAELTACLVDSRYPVDDLPRTYSLEPRVLGAANAATPESVWVRYLAALLEGGRSPLDLEARLYEHLLAEVVETDDPRLVDYMSRTVLAYTPSRARRRAFVDAGIARCADEGFVRWQRDVVVLAADELGDAPRARAARTACGEHASEPMPWLTSHLGTD